MTDDNGVVQCGRRDEGNDILGASIDAVVDVRSRFGQAAPAHVDDVAVVAVGEPIPDVLPERGRADYAGDDEYVGARPGKMQVMLAYAICAQMRPDSWIHAGPRWRIKGSFRLTELYSIKKNYMIQSW